MPLCGNSIGTDRRFLAAYLPEIEDHLHYRSIDVSSVKELVRRWYPKIGQRRPKKDGPHRALDDIRDSIEELRYYRERVFVPAGAADCRRPDRASRRPPDVRPSSSPSTADRTCCACGGRRAGPGPDEVLVDVHHTAVNRADVLQRMGFYPDPRRDRPMRRPRSPASSTPESSPPSATRVTDWRVGDQVMGIEAGGGYAEQLVDARPSGDADSRRAAPSPTQRPCPRCSSRRGMRSSCRAG